MRQAHRFDPRQEMGREDFELQYKRDTYLKDVELHHHDFYEIYFLISGDVTYTIESRQYHVAPGNLLLISPQELHQICIRPEMSAYERFVLWVDPKLLSRLSTPLSDLTRNLNLSSPKQSNLIQLKSEDKSNLHKLFEQLWQEMGTEGYGSDLLRNSLLVQLLVAINRLSANPKSVLAEVTHSTRRFPTWWIISIYIITNRCRWICWPSRCSSANTTSATNLTGRSAPAFTATFKRSVC